MARSRKKSWNCVNLKPLVRFIEDHTSGGVLLADIAKRLGVSEQRVSIIFINDNIKLSVAVSLVATYGYSLKMSFGEEDLHSYDGHLHGLYPNAGLLTGLGLALEKRKRTLNAVANQVGCSRDVLTRAFDTGDIMISNLCRITSAMEIQMDWIFEKVED